MKHRIKQLAIFACGLMVGIGLAFLIKPGARHETHGHGEKEAGHAADTVVISSQSAAVSGIRSVAVRKGGLPELVSMTGTIAQDGASLAPVSSPAAGVLALKRVLAGERVAKGQWLVSVAVNPPDTALAVLSPIEGVVVSDLCVEGQSVNGGSLLYAVADMSKLQAVLDVFEKDAQKIRIGQRVSITPSSTPGRRYSGKVIYLSPQIDDATRTMKVRCLIEEPGSLLKLGMHLQADVEVPRKGADIYVPLSAVYRDGETHFVMVALADTMYARRPVVVADETDEWAIIRSGLALGERVAADGSFLLKSELMRSRMGDGCAD